MLETVPKVGFLSPGSLRINRNGSYLIVKKNAGLLPYKKL